MLLFQNSLNLLDLVGLSNKSNYVGEQMGRQKRKPIASFRHVQQVKEFLGKVPLAERLERWAQLMHWSDTSGGFDLLE